MVKHYVVGFLLAQDGNDWCLMVKKKKPSFMKGFWNGIGGTRNEDETWMAAINREAMEEAGLRVVWIPFAIIYRPSTVITCFRSSIKERISIPSLNDVGEEQNWVRWRTAGPIFQSARVLLELAKMEPTEMSQIYLGEPT